MLLKNLLILTNTKLEYHCYSFESVKVKENVMVVLTIDTANKLKKLCPFSSEYTNAKFIILLVSIFLRFACIVTLI